jgi:hypothetical protein
MIRGFDSRILWIILDDDAPKVEELMPATWAVCLDSFI